MPYKQPTMIIDLTKCVSCHNCQVACKDEHVDNDWSPIAKPQPEMGHFWMKVNEKIRGTTGTFGTIPKVKVEYTPVICMHCVDAPCVKAGTGGAVYTRPDGIVIIDPVKSVGQKQVVASCPYGVVYWNDQLNIPQKCTFCAHLLDKGWELPRCVESCQGYAITFGEYADLQKTIQQTGAVTMHPEFGLKTNVYYVGLSKGLFIAGALVDSKTDDCVEGADVTVTDSTGQTLTAKSDNFGDFWVKDLAANKTYDVTISKSGMTTVKKSVTLNDDTNLGDILL